MLATRNNQENVVFGQQMAAAAKPQNQGMKGLGARTPGNKATKTPFRVALNDENEGFRGVKSVSKTNGGEADENAFVTPAGPRVRAPLGMKTTNAKAKAYHTPAPLFVGNHANKTVQKSVSPRLRRAKVKIHQPELVTQEEGEEEPEIEYCPPKEVPLPDHPSDSEDEFHWGPNKKFPMFESDNLTRGYAEVYFNPTMPNGETYLEQKAREKAAKDEADLEAMENKISEDHWKETEANLRDELGLSPLKLTPPFSKAANEEPVKKATARGLSSRAAAISLAAPTKSSAARQVDPQKVSRAPAPSLQPRVNRKPQPLGQRSVAHARGNSEKHATASAAARSTLGYSKGRAAISKLHTHPLRQKEDQPVNNRRTSALESLGLGDEDYGLFGAYDPGEDNQEEEEDVFQLTLGA